MFSGLQFAYQLLAMQQSKRSTISRSLIIGGCIFLIVAILVYRPLPKGFTKRPLDRITMHVIEPALRVTYYWPSRFIFNSATEMVWWTRLVLNSLAVLVGPFWSADSQIHMATEFWRNVKVRVYWPRANASTDGAVIFIHGGGFALGNVEIYESLTRRISKSLNSVVVSIDYRLSPETPFPGGLNDCENVLEHFMEIAHQKYGVDTNKIVIMGDSAGGNLATVIAQRRKLANKTQLAGQVLMYPLLQLADLQSMSYRYYHHNLDGFALVDPESVAMYYMFYAGIDMNEHKNLLQHILTNGHITEAQKNVVDKFLRYNHNNFTNLNYSHSEVEVPPRAEVSENVLLQEMLAPWIMNPDFSPLMREDLSGLPPTFLMTCEFDVLRDEGIMYGIRLQEAGVHVVWKNYENGFHAMLNFHNEVEEASASLVDILKWTENILKST